MPIIAQLREKSNQLLGRIPEGTLTIALVALASTGSFGLGILSVREGRAADIQVQQLPLEAGLPAASTAALSSTGGTELKAPSDEPSIEPIAAGGQYVASKNGTRYYLPWCGGVKNIKEENRVWFDSKSAAEAAGYTPAVNCKGI